VSVSVSVGELARRGLELAVPLGALLGAAACTPSSIPDPTSAARGFARACERGDARAVRALLSEDQQRTLDARTIAARLAEGGAPLKARCRALASTPLTVAGSATMQYATGETATVVYEQNAPRIAAAGALPGGGATPEAALASFRSSIVRWLAGSTLGPFTASTTQRTTDRLRALAQGLARPEALLVDVAGDRAKVDVEAGHFVSLRREAGLWRVETFE